MEQTLPKLFKSIAEKYPDIVAQYSRNVKGDFDPVTYKEAYQISLDFGAGLLSLGLKRNDNIGIISDNRKEWMQADMGLMAVGCRDVPRGCDATVQDLTYILSFADCTNCIAENPSQIRKILSIKKELPALNRIISFEPVTDADEAQYTESGVSIETFDSVIKLGREYRAENTGAVEAELEKGERDDIAGIIFTSGTTGTPKGVMLSHGNFLTQLDELPERIYLHTGERALLVLPVWHVFERLCEYVIIIQAATLCYSKPIASILLGDFQKLNPQLMPAVPRVFEAVYNGIYRQMRKTGGFVYLVFSFFVGVAKLYCRIERTLFGKTARFGRNLTALWWPLLIIPFILLWPLKKLGGLLVFRKIKSMLGKNFRAGISGGGALPPGIDAFFWAVGVNIVEGYGLTETAPVVSVRPIDAPVFGTVGTPIRGVEARVVDDNGNDLGRCKKGVLQIRGGTVMKGYYKRDDLTSKAITADGWLDTGDIAILTANNEIVLRGRKKDTIVLRGGENVEPLPIEMKLSESRYITAAVVVGQDERYLAALIQPSKDDVESYAKENALKYTTYESLLKKDEIRQLFENEIANTINSRNGFKMFERINKFTFITKEFEVGVELSAKQEIMRFRINEIYKKEIAAMFK